MANMVFLKITILGNSKGAVAPSASRSRRAGIGVIGEYYMAKSVCASIPSSFFLLLGLIFPRGSLVMHAWIHLI